MRAAPAGSGLGSPCDTRAESGPGVQSPRGDRGAKPGRRARYERTTCGALASVGAVAPLSDGTDPGTRALSARPSLPSLPSRPPWSSSGRGAIRRGLGDPGRRGRSGRPRSTWPPGPAARLLRTHSGPRTAVPRVPADPRTHAHGLPPSLASRPLPHDSTHGLTHKDPRKSAKVNSLGKLNTSVAHEHIF